MKPVYPFILIFLFVQTAVAAPVSLEQFKQLDADARRQALAEAAPEQKTELEKIDLHLKVLQHYGSEQAVREEKGREVAIDRGFAGLDSVVGEYNNLWSFYVLGVVHANERMGMEADRRAAIEQRLLDEEAIHVNRFKDIYALVAGLAVSPQSSALEAKAKVLRTQFRQRYGAEGGPQSRPVTLEELTLAEKQIDQMLIELKGLPKLAPEQVQREIDGFPERRLARGGTILSNN